MQICIFSLLSALQFFMKGRASFIAFRFIIAVFQGGVSERLWARMDVVLIAGHPGHDLVPELLLPVSSGEQAPVTSMR